MNLEDYAKYYLNKCNNDINLTMKVINNDAQLAALEGDTEDFERSTEVFQHLEVIKSNRVA